MIEFEMLSMPRSVVMRVLKRHQRDGEEFLEVHHDDWLQAMDEARHYASTDGGSTYRLGRDLLSMEHDGNDWKYFICLKFFEYEE